MKKIYSLFFLFFFISNYSYSQSINLIDDWTSRYDQFLKKYIKKGEVNGITLNLVDYKGIREDSGFEKLETDFSKIQLEEKFSKEKKLAYWINAYNFLTIVQIVRHPGLASIKKLNKPFGTIWEQSVGIVNSKNRSLDEIENEIIMKEFNDPRIYFAVNCASISCPDLRAEAYTEKNLYDQLQDQINLFLHNDTKGMTIDDKQRTIYLSNIFLWHKDDFNKKNVKEWLKEKGFIEDNAFKHYQVKYFNYNWNINSLPNRN